MENENSSSETTDWRQKADENTEKWGVQPPADIVLALAEELSEVADEILKASEIPENMTDEEKELLALYRNLVFFGRGVRHTLEDTYEDENGNPLPESSRPRILGELETREPVMSEADDLGALAFQLRDSIRSHVDEEPGFEPR